MIPVETRYKSQYEQRLDPFTTFSNQEKQRKYTQLNIVEKIILSMVHFMLSNKIARLFVFAYSVLLHGLVFLGKCSTQCGKCHNFPLLRSYVKSILGTLEVQNLPF